MGDAFLDDMYKTLQDLKTAAIDKKIRMPYIYKQFNVKLLMMGSLTQYKSVMARLVNSLIKGLNDSPTKLPRFILILPDADILRFLNFYTYGVTTVTGCCLTWIINTMDRLIETRKEQLRRRRPGAIVADEPKVIWFTMMNRPGIHYSDLYAVRHKYNKNLKELLDQKTNHFLLDVNDTICHPMHYISSKYMNARGKD